MSHFKLPPICKFTPRNDFVVFELVEFGKTKGGVALPQTTQEGYRNIVRAIGPAVKDLAVGDEVHIMGQTDPPNLMPLPREKNLVVVQEKWIVAVVRGEE